MRYEDETASGGWSRISVKGKEGIQTPMREEGRGLATDVSSSASQLPKNYQFRYRQQFFNIRAGYQKQDFLMRDNFIRNKFLEFLHEGRSLLMSISTRLLRLFVVKIYYEDKSMCFLNLRCKIEGILPFSMHHLHRCCSTPRFRSSAAKFSFPLQRSSMCVSTIAFKYRWEK